MTRRQALALLASATPARSATKPVPALCLFSGSVQRLDYSDLPPIVKQLGFDGVDLTVRPGGHVEPRLSNVDLVRAIEEVRGPGLEVPVITTALTSPVDPTVLPVIAIAGHTQIPLFIPGFFRPDALNWKRDIAGLSSIGAHYQMAMALHNYSGEDSGETSWDPIDSASMLDQHWTGIYFDPIHAGANWEAALKRSLPRLRAVALKDFQVSVAKQPLPCPLGQGIVDWKKFFELLAGAKYYGPLSLRIDYFAKDEIGAISKDCEFARKKMEAAYAVSPSDSRTGSAAKS
jgi:L-ribulose-5-phosphate 3-epimerase